MMSKKMVEIKNEEEKGRAKWAFTTCYARSETAREDAIEKAAALRYERSPFGIARNLQGELAQIAHRFGRTGETHEHLPILHTLMDGALPSSDEELIRWVDQVSPVAEAAGEAVKAAEQRQREEIERQKQQIAALRVEERRLRHRLQTLTHRECYRFEEEAYDDDFLTEDQRAACEGLLDERSVSAHAVRAWVERAARLVLALEAEIAALMKARNEERVRLRRADEARASEIVKQIEEGLDDQSSLDLDFLYEDADELRGSGLLERYHANVILAAFKHAQERECRALKRAQEREMREAEYEDRFQRSLEAFMRVRYNKWTGGRAGRRAKRGHRNGHDSDFRRLARRGARHSRRILERWD